MREQIENLDKALQVEREKGEKGLQELAALKLQNKEFRVYHNVVHSFLCS